MRTFEEREWLKDAAYAANYALSSDPDSDIVFLIKTNQMAIFDPIDSNDTMLNLIFQLKICIEMDAPVLTSSGDWTSGIEVWQVSPFNGATTFKFQTEYGSDGQASLRMAVLRLAAMIGKAKREIDEAKAQKVE